MTDTSDTGPRKIIHVDMDAFFASVEQRDNPELRGVPVAVGGSARRGVVAAASYEARQFGVHSAMPSVTALRKCPALVFVPPRFEVYRAVSQQIRQIFSRYSDLVEPLSLDEAYLDVSLDKQKVGSATGIAQLIRQAILDETGLTASAGVSYNKFLAKIASDQNKPNGIFVIRPQEGEAFVASLPVRRFYGVGPKTAEKMARLGIHTGADLLDKDMAFMLKHFGKFSSYLYQAARGIDSRQVKPDRARKSIGRERTYGEDLTGDMQLYEALNSVVDSVWQRIERAGACGRTVTVKIKYADFRQITRSKSFEAPVTDREMLCSTARELLGQILPVDLGVRLLGVTLSGLGGERLMVSDAPASIGSTEQGTFDF